MKKSYLALLITLFANIAFAQKTVCEVHGKFRNFFVRSVGDSILLKYDLISKAGRIPFTWWITEKTSSLGKVIGRPTSIVNYGNETYLYSLEKSKKEFTLNAFIVENKTGEQFASDSPIHGYGNVVGTYIENNNLNIISVGQQDKTIRITRIDKLKIVDDLSFSLPAGIGTYIRHIGSVQILIGEKEDVVVNDPASVKFYKYDDDVYLTADVFGKHMTQVLRFNLRTRDISCDTLNTDCRNSFSSVVIGNKIFRECLYRGRINVSAYDLTTLALLTSRNILAEKPGFPIYFRYTRKNVIHNQLPSDDMLRNAFACQSILAVVRKDGKYIVQVATYRDKGRATNSTLPVGIVTKYFYYTYDDNTNNLLLKDQTPLLVKEKIDRYEIDNRLKKITYQYKKYTPFKNGVLATYYNSQKDRLSLVYFE